MNKEEKKQYMKVWYQKNKGRVLKKQQKIRDDAKIVSTLEKKNTELEQQIEKMKCPWNCKRFSSCKLSNCPCDKWEIKENDR